MKILKSRPTDPELHAMFCCDRHCYDDFMT
jgi:hypothetical protein